MKYKPKYIRTFIGAKDFKESREFYSKLGFGEIKLGLKMSYFRFDDNHGSYLQDYYVKDWVDNSMIFLEVNDLDVCQKDLMSRNLPEQYETVRFSEIRNEDWGRELFMHDPARVLWHFGEFM